MIRAFIAIDLDPAVRDELEKVSWELESLGLDGRLVPLKGVHLTLCFLGNIVESSIKEVSQAAAYEASRVAAFELKLRGLGAFPSPQRPRVVWVGVHGGPPLFRLQQSIVQALEPLRIPLERRPFTPHLTLLRLRSERNVARLSSLLEKRSDLKFATVQRVHEVCLFQSHLSPEGARYTRLALFPLAPGARQSET